MKRSLLIISLVFFLANHIKAQWELLAPLDTVPYNLYCKFFNDSTGVVCSGGYEPDLQIIKTWDYGQTWDTIYTNEGFFTDIDFVSEMIGYLCTYGGPVLKTTDGGNTWNNVHADPDEDFTFQNMFFLNENVGFGTIYTGGGVWKTADGGVNWENLPNSGWGYNLFATSICDIYLSDRHYLIKSNNCTSEWPSYPYNPADVIQFEARNIHMLSDQIGLVGGSSEVNGGSSFISRTSDGGETWSPVVINDAGLHYHTFEFMNNSTGFAGGDAPLEYPFGLLKTEDSGITWGYQTVDHFPTQIENYGPTFVSIRSISCPTGGDTCYAVGALGGIWRTFNGGGPTQALPVSVTEYHAVQKTIKLYPNPATSIIHIELSDAREVKAIEIYNSVGQRVAVFSGQERSIDIGDWPSGCYTVVVRYENEVIRSRFVVE